MGMTVTKPVLNADGSHVAVWHKRKKEKLDIRHITTGGRSPERGGTPFSPIVQIFGCRSPCSAGFGAWTR